MNDHRLDRIDFRRPARFTAVCTCGWQSEPMTSAGLAGAVWDRHLEQVRSPSSASTSASTSGSARPVTTCRSLG